MDPLNRAALIVRPKRRFKEWADSVAGDDAIFDLDMARLSPMVYLVAAHPDDEVEDLIDEYADEIFASQLEQWQIDEAGWPVNRSPHVFRDWFDVTLADWVSDLDPGEPLEYDPALDEDAAPLIEALRGNPDAPLTCAWCEREIGPDEALVSLYLKGQRGPEPEARVIDVPVAGRVLKGVVPSDDSEGGRTGVCAFMLFCSDECGMAVRDVWTAERGEPADGE